MPIHTCSLPYEWAEFSAEENIHMVENELHHHRLDTDFHEGCCAAEAGRFNLFRPETNMDKQQWKGKNNIWFSEELHF